MIINLSITKKITMINMNKFPAFIMPSQESLYPSNIELNTKIIWGDEYGGSNCFPKDIASIHSRKYMKAPKPFDEFAKAVSTAVERVWVIDPYFLIPDHGNDCDSRIINILDWLPLRLEANDIRILTKKHKEIDDELLGLFQIKADDINKYQTHREKECTIQICTSLEEKFNFIHDRFAIIDNDLWHFGATVGGFHTSINAASHGWNAVAVGAITFFEMVWDTCKERK